MRFRRSRSERVGSDSLARKRLRRIGLGLCGSGNFAGNGAGGVRQLMDWKERVAGHSVEEVKVALLGRLRQGVHGFAVLLDGEERRLRGKIAIPDVVMHALEMPKPFPGIGVE